MRGVHEGAEDLTTVARHVECEDCHNPHASQAGTHTAGEATAGPAVNGSWGVTASPWPSNWTTPSTYARVELDGDATDRDPEAARTRGRR